LLAISTIELVSWNKNIR